MCKSMPKVYALSGLRAAYLCAAAAALQDPAYYAGRYRETHILREALAHSLLRFGWEITPGRANFLLAHLPAEGPDAARLADDCRTRGLFLRHAVNMGARLSERAVRVAVKDADTDARMLTILQDVCAR